MNYNVVLITSIIKPPNTPLSYSNKRSVFTPTERFEQTKRTFESIKKIPNSYIVCVECSVLSNYELQYFNDNSDIFINLINTLDQDLIYSPYKAISESTQLRAGINAVLKSGIKFRYFYKISGRYFLTDNYDHNLFDNEYINVKKIGNNVNNINTVFYKLPQKYIKEYLQFLEENKSQQLGLEVLFSFFVKNKNVKYIEKMNAAGYVSVCGSYWNG